MLLNPTHEITLSGLPSDVLDAYVRYKKGTRAIVMWVVQYAPSNYAGAKKLPIKELARLVSSLTGKIKHLPDIIHFHFRETIAARRRLSKYFKGFRDESLEDLDTVNHEHFTTSLTKIYTELCAICDQPKQACREPRTLEDISSQKDPTRNLYEGLRVEDLNLDDDSEPPQSMEECSACAGDSASNCPGPQKDICIADDDLGNTLEFVSALEEIHATLSVIEDFWRHASRNDMNSVSAAFATHVGHAMLLQVEQRLRDLDEHLSIEGLQVTCCALVKETSGGDFKSTWHRLLQQLATIQQAVDHHLNDHNGGSNFPSSGRLQKPTDYIKPRNKDDDSFTLASALIENVICLIRSKNPPSAIVRNSTPMYADLGYALFNMTGESTKLRLSLSLHLLSRSYETYILSMQQPAMISKGRLTALKLAQSAAHSVHSIIEYKDCFPCRCSQTIAFHLQSLEEDLTAFAKHKQWDLYFQSPYVTGSHILEMLDLCHYYGSKLFVYRHYIGALVHTYNVLRQLAALEEIPALEYLCETFKDSWFAGGQRPTKSFRACWTRYVGARLKFRKGHRRNRQDSWCMAIPPHAARKAAGLGLQRTTDLKPEKGECMLFTLKHQDYRVTDSQWATLQAEFSTLVNSRAVDNTQTTATSHRLPSLLPMLERDLGAASSLNGGPSKARLNHFDVFRDCVAIVRQISDTTHTDTKEQGMNCICFASAILEGADRIVDARAMGKIDGKGACWTKNERDGVIKTTMDSMKTVLGGKQPSRCWTWEF